MTASELCFKTAIELSTLLGRREVSPVEIVEAHLARIDALNDTLRAYVHVSSETALAAARAAEIAIAHGGRCGPLHGIPVAYKDIYDVQGVPTTACSRIMAGYVATEDSTVVARLRAAGAICLGKLNTFEFASGGMQLFGETRNPWDTTRTTGGSSAGSGGALAAHLVSLATGSDTGGSIRGPASYCGVVGLKPTYGRVSRAGIVPLSWSLDHAGPMARTVADTALLLGDMAGPDARDPTAATRAVPDYLAALDGDIAGLRVGLPRTYFFDAATPEVGAAVRAAADVLQRLGASVCEVDLPHVAFGPAASWSIAYSEAFAFHRRNFLTRPDEYTRDFLQKITTAACLTAEERVTAQRIRQVVTHEYVAALRVVDVMIMPVSTHPAHHVGSPAPGLSGALTRPASLAGAPALSVPCGFSADGLPIGMQIVGRPWDDATVLRAGHAYERATDWHRRRPSLQPGAAATDAPRPAAAATDSGGVDAAWMMEWARLTGLTYVTEQDAGPIARVIGPLKAQLAAARAWLDAGVEPPTRPAPG